MKRRQILIAGATLAAVSSAGFALAPSGRARADKGEVFEDDRILGPADAPVTIIEYSSLTCPHCASFHATTYKKVKAEWIDQGKARFVHRHFPLDRLALRASLLANCLDGQQHFAMLDTLFSNQQRWARAEQPLAVLAGMARLAGIDEARFEACVTDEAEIDRILERAQDGQDTYDVNSTPTLIVNGTKVEGSLEYERFAKILEDAASGS